MNSALKLLYLLGPSRYGLGNIRVSDEVINNGASVTLWIGSCTNALVSVLVMCFTLWIGQVWDFIDIL